MELTGSSRPTNRMTGNPGVETYGFGLANTACSALILLILSIHMQTYEELKQQLMGESGTPASSLMDSAIEDLETRKEGSESAVAPASEMSPSAPGQSTKKVLAILMMVGGFLATTIAVLGLLSMDH